MIMKQSKRSFNFGKVALLTCLLFGHTFLKIKVQSDSKYEFEEVDLNDIFESSDVLKTKTTKRRLETNTVNVLTDNLTSGPKATTILKNDEILPDNLFESEDVELSQGQPHDPAESNGYLQVLNAMRIQPLGVAPAPPQAAVVNQKVVEAKPGLNNALLKVLTITNQFTDNAKPALTSSGVTINDLTQYYSSILFGRKYVETRGGEVVSEPVDEQDLLLFNPKPTTVQEVVEKVQTTVSEEPAEQQVEPAEEDAEVSSRLLSLIHLYKEHVDLKDADIVADQSNYGHIKHLSANLKCLVDHECDFEKHLSASRSGHSGQRHLLDKHMLENESFVPSLDNPLHQHHLQFLQSLSSLVSDQDIKKATSEWIENSKGSLDDFENHKWPEANQQFQTSLADFKQIILPQLKTMTPDELLVVLNDASKKYKVEIDRKFTQGGLDEQVKCLVNERNGIQSLYDSLKAVIPAHGVLSNDFDRLIVSLNRQINTFEKAKSATPEQIENAKTRVKNEFQRNINGVDAVKNAELIRKVSANVDAVLKADFGKSLNKDNLDFIIHKSIGSLKTDFDQMKNANKQSGFMLDKTDLEHVTRDVLDELKREREPGQAVVLNLVDLHKEIQELNKLHSAQPDSHDEASNAADILISHENYLYQRLSSDDFYADLNKYVNNYYSVYMEHMRPLDDFFDFSAAFKTMTNGLYNPKALGTANQFAARALFKTCDQQMKHLYALSEDDKTFFKVINHLVAEWALTNQPMKMAHKLDKLIAGLQGRSLGRVQLIEIPEHHLVFALFDQVSSSVTTLIDDFGTGVKASIGLSNTIGEGQVLAQNVASEYQVGDLLTNTATPSSGVLGSVKDKFSSWWGRKLDVHYGLMDTIDSVKNVYSNIVEAKKTADQLKDTFQKGKDISDGAEGLVKAFSG
jgi:hypothetical protein